MSRTQIFEGIFGTLQADTALMGLLGPPGANNPRIMRSFPQLQALLATGYEPTSSDAWLVFQEPGPYPTAMTATYDSSWEVIEIGFHVFSTRYSLADDVIDRLDSYWHWSVDQQREVQYGERILLGTRRYRPEEVFSAEIKLPQKSAFYRMRFVLETQHA